MRISPIHTNFYTKANINKGLSLSINLKKNSFQGHFEDTACIIPSQYHTELEQNISKKAGIMPTPTVVKKFKNTETYVNINGNIRGKDVYIMPAAGPDTNENLMETYLKADAAKRAGAKKVIAVMPCYDYARQEKKTEDGEPIAAKLNMDLLKTAGVDEIITEDLHTPAIEGFADKGLKITHLESLPLIKDYFESKNIPDLIVVSPDAGGIRRASNLAKALNCDKAVIYKSRQEHNKATAEFLLGDVNGKNCIIYDDIIDTAGTIGAAVQMLKDNGAKDIYVSASHGLFNGNAIQNLENLPIKEVVVTNGVKPKPDETEKIKRVDISDQIAEAMKEITG